MQALLQQDAHSYVCIVESIAGIYSIPMDFSLCAAPLAPQKLDFFGAAPPAPRIQKAKTLPLGVKNRITESAILAVLCETKRDFPTGAVHVYTAMLLALHVHFPFVCVWVVCLEGLALFFEVCVACASGIPDQAYRWVTYMTPIHLRSGSSLVTRVASPRVARSLSPWPAL